MSSLTPPSSRVLSGMRPTGALHLGHYHGALKNWVELQDRHECFFFVADWHALTTHYQDRSIIEKSVADMVIDWLAAGLNPNVATLFIQSRLTEHAELFTLLAMGTPLAWLERIPTFKDQIEKLKDRDLATYGFLGYPLLQAADILIYQASFVPVGLDQAPHVEICREVARRFNHLYGRDPDLAQKMKSLLATLPSALAKAIVDAAKQFQELGDDFAWQHVQQQLPQHKALSLAEQELIQSFVCGTGRTILREPQVLLTPTSKLPGLDGDKMSKSYGNTIAMREQPKELERKIKLMPTDTQRVRRSDPGDPKRCPVWQFHQVYSDAKTQTWVQQGCTTASIGCLDCKQPLTQSILQEQAHWHERAKEYLDRPYRIFEILEAGSQKARLVAQQTMQEVRQAIGLAYP